MTIEVTNTSGQLVPATEINSLLTFALLELELNPECEVNVSFVDDDCGGKRRCVCVVQNEEVYALFHHVCLDRGGGNTNSN